MCIPIAVLPPFVRWTLVRVRQTGGGGARCRNCCAFLLLLFQNSGQEHHLFLLGYPEETEENISGNLSQHVALVLEILALTKTTSPSKIARFLETALQSKSFRTKLDNFNPECCVETRLRY